MFRLCNDCRIERGPIDCQSEFACSNHPYRTIRRLSTMKAVHHHCHHDHPCIHARLVNVLSRCYAFFNPAFSYIFDVWLLRISGLCKLLDPSDEVSILSMSDPEGIMVMPAQQLQTGGTLASNRVQGLYLSDPAPLRGGDGVSRWWSVRLPDVRRAQGSQQGGWSTRNTLAHKLPTI
jgi:hypothetical protein